MGKWKVLVLWHVLRRPRRYGELKRLIQGISHKVLAETLKSLEE
ncbi:MAG: winged helix-turn-helix transcriptional regulator, partial [Exiguobacterium sp.]